MGAGLREKPVVAGCKGRDSRAGGGSGDGRGSWVSEAGARGSGRAPPRPVAGAWAPGGRLRTWWPSCGGG